MPQVASKSLIFRPHTSEHLRKAGAMGAPTDLPTTPHFTHVRCDLHAEIATASTGLNLIGLAIE